MKTFMTKTGNVSSASGILFIGLFAAIFFLPDFLSEELLNRWGMQGDYFSRFLLGLGLSYVISAVVSFIVILLGWDENSVKPIRAFNDGYFKGGLRYGTYKYSDMEGWGGAGFRYARFIFPIGRTLARMLLLFGFIGLCWYIFYFVRWMVIDWFGLFVS